MRVDPCDGDEGLPSDSSSITRTRSQRSIGNGARGRLLFFLIACSISTAGVVDGTICGPGECQAADFMETDWHRRQDGCEPRPKPSAGATRYGEADHPGPGRQTITVGPVEYPPPDQVGAYGAMLELGAGGEANDDGGRRYALKVDTTNATSWGAMRRYLRRTDADLVLAQEHHLGPEEVAAKSAWALRRGWHAIFAPAQRGDGQGWRAGVAIFARPFLGLAMPRTGGHVVIPHRAVAATVSPPGYRQLTVVSLYLEDGKGVGEENLSHLADVATFLTKQGDEMPYVIGGDFQMRPQGLATTGFASDANADIVASGNSRGTCRSSRASSEIDLFCCPQEHDGRDQGRGNN